MPILTAGLVTLLLGLVAALWAMVRFMLAQRRLAVLAQQDDWEAVRDEAGALAAEDGWRAEAAGAATLLGLAHTVLGDLPAARAAFERGMGPDQATPYRDLAARQLVSVDRMEGDIVAARTRLATLDDRWSSMVRVQEAMVELADGRPAVARDLLVDVVEELRPTAARGLPSGKAARSADVAQALVLLAQARRQVGDVRGARLALDEAAACSDGRPYVDGLTAVEAAAVALDQGDLAQARREADRAVDLLAGVGARIDHARALAVRGRVRRAVGDTPGATVDLDAARATLVQTGAREYLADVDEAAAG